MKKVMMVNEACDNCGDCVKSCSEVHEVSGISIWEHEGRYLPVVCQHCTSSPCMEVCPVSAIESKDGVIYLDKESCIGCGLCAMACPFGAIYISGKTAHKCDLCFGRDEQACVKACSKRCLEVVNVDELVMDKKLNNIENLTVLGSKGKSKKKKGLLSLVTVSSRCNP
ncbi:pyruvate oxidoreductase-associated protein [Methanococcus maripaludis X1]|uniref:Pyruvate oxidoreductase-associated protein n=1 Tax=Methanococcus maripaludis X1 TaxID=1053692 RepID=G0H2X7_METMI|nr:4Fe-4S dicluster domain-containing protein [Methanococcus maripaludis]AEK20524.1 pyruvate oxidoreductase-associated protein [Methanococcus maripaludis X1]